MAKKYVYLLGGDKDTLTKEDRQMLVKLGCSLQGYCNIQGDEGFAIEGTMKGLKSFFEDYVGVDIAEDYLYDFDVFDDFDSEGLVEWEDIKFFNFELLPNMKFESKKRNKKSLKESGKFDFSYFANLLANDKCFESYYTQYDDDAGEDNIHSVNDGNIHYMGVTRTKSTFLPVYVSKVWFLEHHLEYTYHSNDRYRSSIYYDDIDSVHYMGDGHISFDLKNGMKVTFEMF